MAVLRGSDERARGNGRRCDDEPSRASGSEPQLRLSLCVDPRSVLRRHRRRKGRSLPVARLGRRFRFRTPPRRWPSAQAGLHRSRRTECRPNGRCRTSRAIQAVATRSATGSTSSFNSTRSARRSSCLQRLRRVIVSMPDIGTQSRWPLRAIESRWQEPDAGIWEIDSEHWAHSRLTCVSGLRAIAAEAPIPQSGRWSALADAILADVSSDCLHPEGRWQRAPGDPSN